MNATYSKIKVLILGGTGLLGASLMPVLKGNGYSADLHGRNNATEYNADISDEAEAYKLLNLVSPDVIVNLIGLTDVDRCESYPNEAYLVNVRTVENIANWMKNEKVNCHLVHISTDQVYDGGGPHGESQVTLTNTYAFSKYAGELAATNVQSTILRTNFFGCSKCDKRVSLTDWLYSALSDSDTIQVFDDVLFNPLSMRTLSEMIVLSIEKRPVGIFNLGSHMGMSKADFAFKFAEVMGFSTRTMVRVKTDLVTFLKTYRPKDMRMECSKFEETLGIRLPNLTDEIHRVVKEYYEIP